MRKFTAATLIVPSCLLAGCGAYGSNIAQGSKKDTPLEAGIGQEFQKYVPSGTAVKDVHCLRVPTPVTSGKCKILMIRGRPNPTYTYLVSTARHRFVAWNARVEATGKWIPPGSFSGGY